VVLGLAALVVAGPALPARAAYCGPERTSGLHESANTLGAGSAVSLAPATGTRALLAGVSAGYNSATAGGAWTVVVGGVTEAQGYVTSGGGPVVFTPPLSFAPDEAVTVAIASGGAGVRSFVSAWGVQAVEACQATATDIAFHTGPDLTVQCTSGCAGAGGSEVVIAGFEGDGADYFGGIVAGLALLVFVGTARLVHGWLNRGSRDG